MRKQHAFNDPKLVAGWGSQSLGRAVSGERRPLFAERTALIGPLIRGGLGKPHLSRKKDQASATDPTALLRLKFQSLRHFDLNLCLIRRSNSSGVRMKEIELFSCRFCLHADAHTVISR